MIDKRDKLETSQSAFRVGSWIVEPSTSRIRRSEAEVKLEPKVMEVLCYMADRQGKLITRENLEADVWTGTVVGYDALTATIIKLRKALHDNPKNPRYIETLPKKGYRLIAKVHRGKQLSSNSSLPNKKKFSLSQAILLLVLISGSITGWFYLGEKNNELTPKENQATQALAPDKPTIAVLPFTNLNQQAKQNYFSDGITEDLATDLSGVLGLYVIARRSTNTYRGKTVEIEKVSKELNVDYIVEGSVQNSGKQIRVNARLINAKTNHQIWAERYDRKLKDIFSVQDDISNKILTALKIKLTSEEKKRIAHRYTKSLKAYEIFLQGQSYLIHQTKEHNKTARKLFLDAIEIDPGFARAYGGLALTHAYDFRFHWTYDQTKTAKEALQAGKLAISLDEYSPHARWVLGLIYLFVKEDHEQAIKMGLQTINIAPNHADGLMLLAVTYVFSGEPEKARALVLKAKRLNPFYPSQYPSVLGLSNLLIGDFAASIKAYEESIEINTSRLQPNIYLAASYYRAGQLDAAVWQAEQIKLNFPFFSLEDWVSRQPFRDRRTLNSIIKDLRATGL